MGPTVLSAALRDFPKPNDPNLLVGFESSDDAAVYKVSDELAVISTVDFITPPVDDPAWFGRIGAANSLSDVYAMGGRPITALNLVMYPSKKLGLEILREILQGAFEKVAEAGAVLAGGHSVDDEEPKFGLAVTGIVHPDRVLTNTGARAGDVLILTKPLGTGVLFNACRAKKLPWPELESILPEVASLNGTALDIALPYEIHACTDVTGFGVLGHTMEMAKGSGLAVDLEYAKLPFYPNALAMYRKGQTTGSNKANRDLVSRDLELSTPLNREQEEILFDPQTSGGLLLAVSRDSADSLLKELHDAHITHARIIGETKRAPTPGINIV